ncbi:MAG: pyruvate kinase [Gallintestinimicrobium sp.]
MRRTKIICTIGPSSQDEDMLRKIILAGMNGRDSTFPTATMKSMD